ncbi:MAG: cation transporter [Acidobacteriota bacterium]
MEKNLRLELLKKGLRLEYFTIGWNVVEAIVAIGAGIVAGSIALVGFGLDSIIETASGAILFWRLKKEIRVGSEKWKEKRKERGGEREKGMEKQNEKENDEEYEKVIDEEIETAEKRALLVVGITFLLLAFYVAYESGKKLILREMPEESIVGIVLAALSLIVMPVLSYLKMKTARQLNSKALEADAMETAICSYLSFTLLLGLTLNATLGWWWADPVAAIAMLPVIIKEGREAVEEAR